MFVVATDFDVPPYNLPNVAKNNSFLPYVDTLEKRYLREIFGGNLYDAFVEGIDDLPDDWVKTVTYGIDALVTYNWVTYKSKIVDNLNVTPGTDGSKWEIQPLDRWQKIILGDTYKIKGENQEWKGLVTLLQPLVYALWSRDTINDNLANSGLTISQNENSEVVSFSKRFSDALNDHAELVGKLSTVEKNTLYLYLKTNADVYEDVINGMEQVSSFSDYLLKKFCNPGKTNVFGF